MLKRGRRRKSGNGRRRMSETWSGGYQMGWEDCDISPLCIVREYARDLRVSCERAQAQAQYAD
jgi:hypothetical protein